MSRLKEKYQKDVVPALHEGVRLQERHGRAARSRRSSSTWASARRPSNAKIIDTGADELARITGQKPVTRRAKKSIAQFKVRKGQPVGDDGHAARRADVGVPRSADERSRCRACATSRACRRKGFDGRGNYTLGLRDQLLFPEIDYMKVDKARGMNVSVVTTAKTDEEARKLLQFIGMPFRQN